MTLSPFLLGFRMTNAVGTFTPAINSQRGHVDLSGMSNEDS